MKFLYILFIVISSSFYSQKYQNEHLGDLIKDYISVKYPNEVLDKFLYIGINRQKLFLFESKNISQVFNISTSKWGNGNELSSKKLLLVYILSLKKLEEVQKLEHYLKIKKTLVRSCHLIHRKRRIVMK